MLAYMVQRYGRVVKREELMQALWPDVEVTDESVTRCIADIRKVLADDSQRLIRTVPRRGYVFASTVTTPVIEFPRPEVSPGEPISAPPPNVSPRWRRNRPVFIAAICTALLGFVAWRFGRVPASLEPLRAVPLLTMPGGVRYPTFSPEGDYVAFTWAGPNLDNPDVYIQQIGSGSPLRLTTDPANDYNPVWSPDGKLVAFLRRHPEDGDKSDLLLTPPLSGPQRKLAEIRVPNTYFVIPPYLCWCPDSRCVVVTNSTGEGQSAALFVVRIDTGERRQLTHPQPPASADTNPAISPDGNWLVFRRQANGSRLGELSKLRLEQGIEAAGEPQRLTPAALDAGYPSWKHNSEEIVFSSEASESRGSLWRLGISNQETTPTRLPFVGEDGLMPAISRGRPGRDSRLVYVRSFQDSNIWRIQTPKAGAPASAPPVLAISSSRRDCTPQLSPDGRRVAFASDRSGAWEVWLSDPDGSNAVRLTSLGLASAPSWSPDGNQIVVQAAPDAQSEVYLIPSSGGKACNLTSHPAQDTRPSFSRDGKSIYFTSNRTGTREIWKMSVSGGNAVQLTHNGAFAAFESPDSRFVYYNQTMDSPSPLWRVPSSGGAPEKVLDGVVLAAFAVLERGIYYIDRPSRSFGVLYIDRPSGETRLQYFDFETRSSTTIARELGNVYLGLTASRDGRSILFSRVDSSLDDLMLLENFR